MNSYWLNKQTSISYTTKYYKTKDSTIKKLIKQTSFTIKNPEGKPSQKTIHYNKEKFKI